jgi:hypothetical protein
MYLILYAELLLKMEIVKQPSPSVIPLSQPSLKDGLTQSVIISILLIPFFNSFSLKKERKDINLAFLVGKTILPLNNKHIRYKLFKS